MLAVIPPRGEAIRPAGAAILFIGKPPSFFKDSHEHLACKLAGLGVLVGGMIGGQQHSPIGNFVLAAVLKQIYPAPFDDAELLEMSQVGVERNPSQRNHYFQFR